MKKSSLKLSLICGALLAGGWSAQALESAVVIANNDVRVDSLSAAALKDIYTGKTKYWPDGESVVIVVLADQTDAALAEVSGMDASQFRTFWQRMVFSGRGQQPKKVTDTTALVAMVAATKGAIALVPKTAAVDGVKQLGTN